MVSTSSPGSGSKASSFVHMAFWTIIVFFDLFVQFFLEFFTILTLMLGIVDLKGYNTENLKISLFASYILLFLYHRLFLRNNEDD